MPCELPGKLDSVLEGYFNEERFKRSAVGAASAWHGYELQTLYICERILRESSRELIFLPETVEDLLVIKPDGSVEAVQVKAKNSPLTLSDVIPSKGKEDSFFGHVAYFLANGIEVTPVLVSCGPLSPELRDFQEGDRKGTKAVLGKISKAFGDAVGSCCREKMAVETVTEKQLRENILNLTSAFPVIKAACKLYQTAATGMVRDAERDRQRLGFSDFEILANRIAFSGAGISGQFAQFGKTLFPLIERFKATAERPDIEDYRLGIDAVPEHIACDFDFPREKWVDAIDAAFSRSQMVIVHGASGQGKSTICFRYLYERVPACNCYLVTGLSSLEDAQGIVAFFNAVSEEHPDECQYLYIDNASGEEWLWLASSIEKMAKGQIKLLLSAREESLNGLDLSSKSLSYEMVCPLLLEHEARGIYNQFQETSFPSFEESWRSFGEAGPLMEYTASLISGTHLGSMISGQVNRFYSKGDDSWIDALCIASVAGAENLEVSIPRLKEVTGCRDMSRLIGAIEDEHLVRKTGEDVLGPLHAFRSRAIAEFARKKSLLERDELLVKLVRCVTSGVSSALVHCCGPVEAIDGDLARSLVAAAEGSWEKTAEVVKFALWVDTRRVFDDTAVLRERLFSYSVSPFLSCMMVGGVSGIRTKSNSRSLLLDLIKDEARRDAVSDLLDELAGHECDFALTKDVLESMPLAIFNAPVDAREAKCAGFTLALMGHFNYGHAFQSSIGSWVSVSLFESLPLSEALDLALGIQLYGVILDDGVVLALKERIEDEHSVLWDSSDDSSVDILLNKKDDDRNLNDSLVEALCCYRRLFPFADNYSGSLLGASFFVPEEKMPLPKKEIPSENLPILWFNVPDRLFSSMCRYEEAPGTWGEFRDELTRLFQLVGDIAHDLSRAIDKSFSKGCFVGIKCVPKIKEACHISAGLKVHVPRCNLDSSGYSNYISAVDSQRLCSGDSSSVHSTDASRSRFSTVLECANSIGSFLRDVDVLLRVIAGAPREGDERCVRFYLASLVRCASSCPGARRELLETFSGEIMPEALAEQLLVLACCLSVRMTRCLEAETGLLFSQQNRARKIMNAKTTFLGVLSTRPEVKRCLESNGAISLTLEVSEIECDLAEIDHSLSVYMCSAYTDAFGESKGLESLVETLSLGKYLGEVEMTCLYRGYFLCRVRFQASQLERALENGGSIIMMPSQGSADLRSVVRSSAIDAWSNAAGLRQLCAYACYINSEILEKEPDFEHVCTGPYLQWRQTMTKAIEEICESLVKEVPAAFEDEGECKERRNALELIEKSALEVPSRAECTSLLDALDTLGNLLLDIIYQNVGRSDGAVNVGARPDSEEGGV